MSASHNGNPDQPGTQMVSQFQPLTPLGTTSGNWLAELKNLGYMPAGQTSWGNIGQTVMVPQPVSSQTQAGAVSPLISPNMPFGYMPQYSDKH